MTGRLTARLAASRWIGAVLLAGVVGFALLGPWLIAADPHRQNLGNILAPIGGGDLLGTDQLGRSMLARLAAASRLSLALALAAVAGAAATGVLLGLLAANGGRLVERGLSLLADAVMALPSVLLVLLFASLGPGQFVFIYLGLASYQWVEYFRVTRVVASAELRRPHVEAARLNGFSRLYVARRFLLPVLAPVLGTLMVFNLATSIFTISALSVIGIGLRPPIAEWGTMTIELLPYYDEAPLHALLPTAMVAATVLALHLLAGRGAR
ncbi:ABC transporter permease [Roseomonas sp. 18066]|uniref:ABC transporter permease n=1 Tax=Roseomonas sp. 18066 TaxID=2681412 RepID=UPI001358C964|nr:ABC transporter permease [Roseomonas sp. 18066]